ncbi:MAG: TRAP transporter substrate-binding protein [Gammaproteobacteria bacterium]|nr:TRAP transporter substrate-binding protein [Gammaproteobacteria bacterium]
MSQSPKLSSRAFLVGVLAAFFLGIVGSLALRPPGAPAGVVSDREDGAPLQAVNWRVALAFGSNLPALGDNIIYVADAVSATSNRRIRLQTFEPGELISAFAITEAVGEGRLPAGYTWLGYDQGRIPASALLGAVPFGMEPWEFMAWWYDGGGRQLAEEMYHRRGVHPLLCGMIGPEAAGWFRFAIEDLSDVRGLKIRFAGLGGRVLQRLGASVTMIPGSELFQALERGAIDALEYSLPSVDERLGFQRVARYNYYPGWHQTFTSFHLVVNLNRWNALPETDRRLLETACTAGVTRNLAHGEAIQGAVIENFQRRGVFTEQLPEDLLRRLRDVSEEVLEEEAAANAEFARILQSQREFRESYAVWKRLAYLPRDF